MHTLHQITRDDFWSLCSTVIHVVYLYMVRPFSQALLWFVGIRQYGDESSSSFEMNDVLIDVIALANFVCSIATSQVYMPYTIRLNE